MTEQTLDHFFISDESAAKPATNKNHLRLYDHKFCPFATKARLVLAAKGVEYQNVGLDMSKKTEWHKEWNGGQVPVLETQDGRIVIESQIIMHYINEKYPEQGLKLWPLDPEEALRYRLAGTKINGFMGPFFGIFMKKSFSEETVKPFVATMTQFENWFSSHSDTKYIMGTENPTMVDIDGFTMLLWVTALEGSSYDQAFQALDWHNKFPKTKAFYEAMRAEFDSVLPRKEQLTNFMNENFAFT